MIVWCNLIGLSQTKGQGVLCGMAYLGTVLKGVCLFTDCNICLGLCLYVLVSVY